MKALQIRPTGLERVLPVMLPVMLAWWASLTLIRAAEPGLRRTALSPVSPSAPGLTRLSASVLGVEFTNRLSEDRKSVV